MVEFSSKEMGDFKTTLCETESEIRKAINKEETISYYLIIDEDYEDIISTI